ncbi:MAG: GNAT family N-acetyltransferase [Phycisphaerae bacterium]|nr:GNAT family N-acetyltransferase [Phycisphaerae bacterium]
MSRIRRYWADALGVPESLVDADGQHVIANAGPRANEFAYVLQCGSTCIVSAGPELLEVIRQRVDEGHLVDPVSVESLRKLFRGLSDDIRGPLFQSYAEAVDFRPATEEGVRKLTAEEHGKLEALAAACDPTEWSHSGLSSPGQGVFACFQSRDIVAAARYAMWKPYAASIGMITHPDCRGRGHGKAVVSAAMRDALDRGHLIIFQTLLGNAPSVALAKRLGCQEYGRSYRIILKNKPD